jgi:hypothetical protein
MTKTASSKLSSNAAVSQSMAAVETPSIVGNGDYAGLSATFSSSSSDINKGVGELIPVPEHLVPESMIEWGDIPTYLEVLSSEDIITLDHDPNNDEEKEQKIMERTVITVLPEVGCGIDNLETTKKEEEFNLQQQQQSDSRLVTWKATSQEHEVVALDKSTEIGGVKVLTLETIFQVDSEVVVTDDNNGDTVPAAAAAQSDNNEKQTSTIYPRRIRISLNVDHETNRIVKDTITLNVERLYSPGQSTKGTRWSGPKSNSGGLDARSVLNHIGRDIVYGDVFAVKRIKSGEDVWTLPSLDSVGDDGDEEENGASIVTIRLPQNIMLRYGTGICCNGDDDEDKWGIELSHLQRGADSKLYRRSVLRSFENSDDIFGSVCYRKE